uniref:EGF-like domain-containing protein n=1 Tax=Labrus bergylta TaxID=56723 RepID=A0A3Q3N8T1_9LABR
SGFLPGSKYMLIVCIGDSILPVGMSGHLPLSVSPVLIPASRPMTKCESTFDKYCLNNGLCMLLVDINEHHCKCEDGFYGPRCGNLELVFQPMAEEQILLTVFCVILLMIGLAGALRYRGFYTRATSRSKDPVSPNISQHLLYEYSQTFV